MISTVGEQALGHVLPHIVSAKLFSFLPTQILWIQFEVYVKTYLRISLCITSPDPTPLHRHCIVEVDLLPLS